MRRRRLALIALGALLAGCDGLPGYPNACTNELEMRLTPHDTTALAGAQFMASIALFTCGGRETVDDTFTWASSDTTVVTLSAVPSMGFVADDGSRVMVTTRAPGVAHVIPSGEHHKVLAGATITVH